jgi:DNA repair exonuclease SbcCD ATPase subunit
VTPDPGQPLVIVGGDNGQGKTSLWDSIAFALGGAKAFPEQPVRQGEDEASVVLTLGDLLIKRKITAEGKTTLVVTSPDGAKYPSAQKMLDGMRGELGFDPLRFMGLEPKAQASILQKLIGVDVEAFAVKRKSLYDGRTDVNREVKRLEINLNNAPEYPNAPAEKQSLSDLADRLQERNAKRAEIDAHRRKLEDAKASSANLTGTIEDLTNKLEAAQRRKQEWDTYIKDVTEFIENTEYPDLEGLKDQMRNIEEINANVQANQVYRELNNQYLKAKEKADSLTARLEELDREKAQALERAELPIDGLSFRSASCGSKTAASWTKPT